MIDLQELYRVDPIKACKLALRRTVNAAPSDRLREVNELLGGYGCEALRGCWSNGYWGEVVGGYVNFGDTYSVTVVEYRTGGQRWDRRFVVWNLGDFVDSGVAKKLEVV